MKVFTQPDPAWAQTPSLGRYVYCAGNPMKYRDPSRAVLETGLDILSVGLSARDMWNDPSWGNAGWLALDVVCAVAPFVPAVGVVRHAGQLEDAARAAGKFFGKGADAAEAVDKTADVARKVPNPGGRLGGEAHRARVSEVYDRAKAEFPGHNVSREGKVLTPGGTKPARWADVLVSKNGKSVKAYQVGKTLADGITPVKRERVGVSDFLRTVDTQFIPSE